MSNKKRKLYKERCKMADEIKSNILKSADDYAGVLKFIKAYTIALNDNLIKGDGYGNVSNATIFKVIQDNYLLMGYSEKPSDNELADAWTNCAAIVGKDGKTSVTELKNKPSIIKEEYAKFKLQKNESANVAAKNISDAHSSYKENRKENRKAKRSRNAGLLGMGVIGTLTLGGVGAYAYGIVSAVGGLASLLTVPTLGITTLACVGAYVGYKIYKATVSKLWKKIKEKVSKARELLKGDENVKGSKKALKKARELEKQNRKELNKLNQMSWAPQNNNAIKELEEGMANELGERVVAAPSREQVQSSQSRTFEDNPQHLREGEPAFTTGSGQPTPDNDSHKRAPGDDTPKPDNDKINLHPGEDNNDNENTLPTIGLWQKDWKPEVLVGAENAYQREELIKDQIYNFIGVDRLDKTEDVPYNLQGDYEGLRLNIDELAKRIDKSYANGAVPSSVDREDASRYAYGVKSWTERYMKKAYDGNSAKFDEWKENFDKQEWTDIIKDADQAIEKQNRVNENWNLFEESKKNITKITDEKLKNKQQFVSDDLARQSVIQALKENKLLQDGVEETIRFYEDKLGLASKETTTTGKGKKKKETVVRTEIVDYKKHFEDYKADMLDQLANNIADSYFNQERKDFRNDVKNIVYKGNDRYIESTPVVYNMDKSKKVEINAFELNEKNFVPDANRILNQKVTEFNEAWGKVDETKKNYRELANKFDEKTRPYINSLIIAEAVEQYLKQNSELSLSTEELESKEKLTKQDKQQLKTIKAIIEENTKAIASFYAEENPENTLTEVSNQIKLKNKDGKEVVVSPDELNAQVQAIIQARLDKANTNWKLIEDAQKELKEFNIEGKKFADDVKRKAIEDYIKVNNLQTKGGEFKNDIQIENFANNLFMHLTYDKRPKEVFVDVENKLNVKSYTLLNEKGEQISDDEIVKNVNEILNEYNKDYESKKSAQENIAKIDGKDVKFDDVIVKTALNTYLSNNKSALTDKNGKVLSDEQRKKLSNNLYNNLFVDHSNTVVNAYNNISTFKDLFKKNTYSKQKIDSTDLYKYSDAAVYMNGELVEPSDIISKVNELLKTFKRDADARTQVLKTMDDAISNKKSNNGILLNMPIINGVASTCIAEGMKGVCDEQKLSLSTDENFDSSIAENFKKVKCYNDVKDYLTGVAVNKDGVYQQFDYSKTMVVNSGTKEECKVSYFAEKVAKKAERLTADDKKQRKIAKIDAAIDKIKKRYKKVTEDNKTGILGKFMDSLTVASGKIRRLTKEDIENALQKNQNAREDRANKKINSTKEALIKKYNIKPEEYQRE